MAELIVALDFNTADDACKLAKKIQGVVPWVKVGLELFIAEGPQIVQKFKAMGFKVFLDLKLYDIPNTVKGAALSACQAGADLLTIHLSGGKRMCEEAAAVSRSHHERMKIFGVSVLTSFEEGELVGYTGKLSDLVEMMAKGASQWGVHGIVCSGHEVEKIKKTAPQLLCLTPGIRLEENKTSDDQRRVMTPRKAVLAGSDFLVVGRPITKADDPRSAAQAINDEIAEAMRELNK